MLYLPLVFSFVFCFNSAWSQDNSIPSSATPLKISKSAKLKNSKVKEQFLASIKKFRESPEVEINVDKKVSSQMLGTNKSTSGQIFYSKGLFKWTSDSTAQVGEKSELIFDGKYVWNIQHPSPDFPGEIQILKSSGNQKSGGLFLRELFDLHKHNPEIMSEENEKAVFTSTSLSEALNVKSLEIIYDIKLQKVLSVSYKDELDNKTEVMFSKITFLKKKLKDRYVYTPPKGAKVTNL